MGEALFPVEPVADAAHADDLQRCLDFRQLLPQFGHVNVDGARRNSRGVVPHVLEDLRAALNKEKRSDRPKLTLLPFLMLPMVQRGQVVIRKMMNLSSSFDHRVGDGFDIFDTAYFALDLNNEQIQRRIAEEMASRITLRLATWLHAHPTAMG